MLPILRDEHARRLRGGRCAANFGQAGDVIGVRFSARKLRRGPGEVEQFLLKIGRGVDDDRVRIDGPEPAVDVGQSAPASVARSVPAAV
jgi:hypothetical protein